MNFSSRCTLFGLLGLVAITNSSSAIAGPVVCTTSFEAPFASSVDSKLMPVEVTRCGAVQTSNELIEQRFFSYSSPYARGIDITHQITDILGISMGGGDGTKVMGFGFPDQTIVWDGSAVENTTKALMQEQSKPIPLRVADSPNNMGK
ncbi:MAG: Occludin/ELL family protein [Synechococcaceae bacterium WB4_2_0811]|nr:Occludin/ELL family protein [Synechococcaceae bacterium WB4_2_0811]